MLRISKLADYGTVVMVYLARHYPQLSNVRTIATHTHIQMPTVGKLLKCLTKVGLVQSVRGVAGGYYLQRSAKEISVAEIIYVFEEQPGLTECSVQPNHCHLEQYCSVRGNWQVINQVIQQALQNVTLEDLANPRLRPLAFALRR